MATESSSDRAVRDGAAVASSTLNARQAEVTNATIEGMSRFIEMAERVAGKELKYQKGHLFEAIVAAKENAAYAAQGASTRTTLTHLQGQHSHPADLERRLGDNVISRAQVKFSNPQDKEALDALVRKLVDPKYEGMDIYVPADHADTVREELLRRADVSEDPQVASRLRKLAKRVQNHDTTVAEVEVATKNPKLYARWNEVKSVASEAGAAALKAATAGLVVSGAIAALQSGLALARGEKSAKEALKDTGKMAAKSSLQSAVVGATGGLIRSGSQKVGVKLLAKTNPATAAAGAIVGIGSVVYRYAKGELAAEEAMERLGETATSALTGLFLGSGAAAVFGGPVGLLVSIGGYLLSSSVYQSCIAVFREARLREEEAERIVFLCEAACRRMREQREEFEREFERSFRERQSRFRACFAAMDEAFDEGDPDKAVVALGAFASMFGKDLRYGKFEEFDRFMTEDTQPLEL